MSANRQNQELSVLGSGYVQRPGAAADVAVLNELALRFRVHVDFDALEAIRANDLGSIVHWMTPTRAMVNLYAMCLREARCRFNLRNP